MAGLAFMYAPSFVDLFRGIWSTDEQAHGPIVFAVSCWLVWRNLPAMWARSEGAQTSAAGWPIFVFGLLLYIAGRSQEILLFEVGSLIWLLFLGTLLDNRRRLAAAEGCAHPLQTWPQNVLRKLLTRTALAERC